MDLTFYNTLSRNKERFVPLSSPQVSMYNCGPTVYSYAHIGNMRAFLLADVIKRTLIWNGYTVKQIMNITDVGHLVSDADEGEDKMEVARKREGRTVEEIITHYSDAFFADLESLNILRAESYPRATHFIEEQKRMVAELYEKGFLYTTSDGIYFDTSKFPAYPDFAKLDISGLQGGARVDLGEKRHPTDFAVWKFSPSDNTQREQEWSSPVFPEKKGFPGWHIECSAIIKATLGDTIDIHSGGVDHIPVHHTNEIAQSESANSKPFVRYWLHSAHMLVNNEKMSKSLGNAYRLIDLHEHGIPPLAYRYWVLTSHYRTQVNFTWDALAAAQTAYNRLLNFAIELDVDTPGTPSPMYLAQFSDCINDDLNTASAIALMWTVIKDASLSSADKFATLLRFDEVLGLGLGNLKNLVKAVAIPLEISSLVELREQARKEKDWVESDRLRDELLAKGYIVRDTENGPVITPQK